MILMIQNASVTWRCFQLLHSSHKCAVQAENLDHVELPQESRDRLAALKAGIWRTAHLLEQLLALAKYEAGRAPQAPRTAFDNIAKEVVADFAARAQARAIDLGFEHIDHVFVDADRTARTNAIALLCLLAASIRYAFDRDGPH
jgi:signal transduction histidine kinase